MEVLADRYELGEPVGAGGMARVHEARDLLLERPVAVKRLRDDIASDDEVRHRFLREARTAAQFNHPNAVAVFDTGEDDGDPWIVMELVQGEDLDQRIRRTGPLEETEAVRIADCVLAALQAAHREAIVHRDVKPANIMLLDDGSVKLADFGIAKSVQDAASIVTATGQLIGTARYLSPEQVGGQPATAASDVYAMGIVLYEMLAGEAPYTGTDPVAVAVAHTREPTPDVLAALPHVSTELAAVITRALAKEPDDRYADAGEMRRALRGRTQPLPVVRGRADRRPPWFLLSLIALALLTTLAIVAVSGNPGADQRPAAETVEEAEEAKEEVPADDAETQDDPVDDADARPPAEAKDDGSYGNAKGNDKPKGKGNGKAKGKKD